MIRTTYTGLANLDRNHNASICLSGLSKLLSSAGSDMRDKKIEEYFSARYHRRWKSTRKTERGRKQRRNGLPFLPARSQGFIGQHRPTNSPTQSPVANRDATKGSENEVLLTMNAVCK